MRKKYWIIYLGLLAAGLLAGAASAQTAPTVPAALVTKTFKAQAQMADAQLQVEHAQQTLQQKTQAMQQVLGELQAACGKFLPQLNPVGDPVCVAAPEKPAAAKAEVKK